MQENFIATITTPTLSANLSAITVPVANNSYLYLDGDLIGEYDATGNLIPVDALKAQIISTINYTTKDWTFEAVQALHTDTVGSVLDSAAASGATYSVVLSYHPRSGTVLISYQIATVLYSCTVAAGNLISGPHIVSGSYTAATKTLALVFDTGLDVGSTLKIFYITDDEFLAGVSQTSYSKTFPVLPLQNTLSVFYTISGVEYEARDDGNGHLNAVSGPTITATIDYLTGALAISAWQGGVAVDAGTKIRANYVPLDSPFVTNYYGHNLSIKAGYFILETLPQNFNRKTQILFEIAQKFLRSNTVTNMDKVQHFYDPEYPKTSDEKQLIFDLFNYKIFDLSSFTDVTKRTQIEDNQLRNIINIYKQMNSENMLHLVFYTYGVTATIYLLNTKDWTGFQRTTGGYLDINKVTDAGLTLNSGSVVDGGSRTPFIENEILLDKNYRVNVTDEIMPVIFDGVSVVYNGVYFQTGNVISGTVVLRYYINGIQYTAYGTPGVIAGPYLLGTINEIYGILNLTFDLPPNRGSTLSVDYSCYALWYYNIDRSISTQIDNIRNILSKIYYTISCPVFGKALYYGASDYIYTETNRNIVTTGRAAFFSGDITIDSDMAFFWASTQNYDDLLTSYKTTMDAHFSYIQTLVDTIINSVLTYTDTTSETLAVISKKVNALQNPGITIAISDGTTLSYSYQIPVVIPRNGLYVPTYIIKPYSVKLTYYDSTNLRTHYCDAAGNFTPGDILRSASVDLRTGIILLDFITAPDNGKDINVSYWLYNFIIEFEVSNIQTVNGKFWTSDKQILQVSLQNNGGVEYFKITFPPIYIAAGEKFELPIEIFVE